MLHSFASWSNFLLKRFAVPFFLLYCRCTGDHAVCWKALLPLFFYSMYCTLVTKKFAQMVCFSLFPSTCGDHKVCWKGLLPLFSYNMSTGDYKVCSKGLLSRDHKVFWSCPCLWLSTIDLLLLSKKLFFICDFYRFLTSLWPSKTDPLIHEATIGIFY